MMQPIPYPLRAPAVLQRVQPAAVPKLILCSEIACCWWCCCCCLQAAALGGTPESTPVSCRVLPASTMEQLEPFFNLQLKQVCADSDSQQSRAGTGPGRGSGVERIWSCLLCGGSIAVEYNVLNTTLTVLLAPPPASPPGDTRIQCRRERRDPTFPFCTKSLGAALHSQSPRDPPPCRRGPPTRSPIRSTAPKILHYP